MKNRNLILFVYISLDGYIAKHNDDISFLARKNDKYLSSSADFMEYHSYNLGLHSGRKLIVNKIAVVPSIKLNNTFSLDNQLVTFDEDRTFGIIGNRFLRNYKVTIDWMHHEILLEPNEPSITEPQKDFGFALLYTNNNSIEIGSIRLNSEAYKKGLRLNDKIIAIDDINFKENTHENYCKYLELRNSWEKVSLLVQRENEELKIRIEKSEIMALIDEK